jgi:hypothetical protein
MLRRVPLVRTIRRNIPEDAILHSHRRENLKFYTELIKGRKTFRLLTHGKNVTLAGELWLRAEADITKSFQESIKVKLSL